MKKIIIILGATGTGKSDLGVKIGKILDGEIISGDSRQIYSELSIGSNKISEKAMDGIPHHMLDIASVKNRISVYDYVKKVIPVIDGIFSRGKIPIIVGGTGFYIDNILYEGGIREVSPNEKLRQGLEKLDTNELYEMLKNVDMSEAERIGEKDKRKIIRSLEIIKDKGSIPKNERSIRYDHIIIGLKTDRDQLKKIISKRIDDRWDEMKREARHLSKIISIEEMIGLGLEYEAEGRYLKGEVEEDIKVNLLNKSMQYVKRQDTWNKRYEKMKWFYPEEAEEIKEFIMHKYQ